MSELEDSSNRVENCGVITPGNFESYSGDLFKALGQVTLASKFLVPGELGYLRASADGFEERLSAASDNLLSLCNRLLVHAAPGSATRTDNRFRAFQDAEDVTNGFSAVVDTVDNLLEKADVCLDQVTGRGKRTAPNAAPQGAAVLVQVSTKRTEGRRVFTATNIARPQLSFEDKVDNSNQHFVSKLTYKPNARQPLDYGLPGSKDISSDMGAHLRTLGITDANSSQYSLPHPYEFEIKNIEYPTEMFKVRPEQLYKSFDETPFTYIDTDDQLEKLADLLNTVDEIAIDLEAHDYRSYQGFVCLMQISTRSEDFIIDTLAVRSKMHLFNTSFTDPTIVKVLHGAESDIVWLQRDFGVYIVNMFDTYHASHLLEMPHHGLAYLLKHYCDVETNKEFQLADWRIRPLPTELMKYARSDTHYLLYIYDRMRNELLNLSNPETHNLLRATLERSETTSLNKYEKEIYNVETGEGARGWRYPLRKHGGILRAEQFAVYRALHAWRDHIAREDDESLRYVLPTHMLFNMADRLPTSQQGILGCCSPIPPLVSMYALDLVVIIENALAEAKRSNPQNEALLKKIAEDEKEWKERKARGPQHKRFDETEPDAMEVDSPAQTPRAPAVEALSASRLFGAASMPDAAGPAVTRVSTTYRSIFGPGSDASEDEEDKSARQMAEEIRKTLFLVAPSSSVMKRKRTEVEDTPVVPPKPSPPVPSKPLPPTVSPSVEESVTSGRDTITIDDEDLEIAVTKRNKQKTKRKSPKGKGAAVSSPTTPNVQQPKTPTEPESTAAKVASIKAALANFKPFDYGSAASVLNTTKPKEAVEKNAEIIVLDSDDETTPTAKASASATPKPVIFDPYGAAPDSKQKKVSSGRRKTAASKSGTFKRDA
ncbi:exosome nuclease subunit [Thoreauomyces humboldtii]|nr:exosome nuclease subunit [Thoreauomyces humboldtii]